MGSTQRPSEGGKNLPLREARKPLRMQRKGVIEYMTGSIHDPIMRPQQKSHEADIRVQNPVDLSDLLLFLVSCFSFVAGFAAPVLHQDLLHQCTRLAATPGTLVLES